MAREDIDIRLVITAQVQAAQEAAAALRSVSGEAQAAAATVQSAFGPQIATSIGQLRQNILSAVGALGEWASQGSQVTGLNRAQQQAILQVVQATEAEVVANKQSVQALRERAAMLAIVSQSIGGSSGALLMQAAAGTNAFSAQLNQLGIEAQKAQRQLSGFEVAGQAMTASFSIAQAAAGNLQSAIFGLGFAFLFASRSFSDPRFLAMITVLSAVQIALGEFQKKLGDASNAAAETARAVQDYNNAVQAAIGPTNALSEAIAASLPDLEKFGLTLEDVAQQQAAEAGGGSFFEKLSQGVGDAIEDMNEFASVDFGPLKVNLAALPLLLTPLAPAALASGNAVDLLSSAFQKMGLSAEEAAARAEAVLNRFVQAAQVAQRNIQASIAEATEKFRADQEADFRLRVQLEGLDNARDQLQDELQDITEAINKSVQDQVQAVRDAHQDFVDARREQLEDELDVIREGAQEQVDVRRDALEQELDILEQELDKAVEARREALEAELDTINDAYDAQVDAVQEWLEEEIERARDAYERAVDARREQLEDELDAIRDGAEDAIDARRDALEDEIDLIRKAADEQVDAVRSAAKAEQDAIRAAAQARLREIQSALKAEQDAIKDAFEDQVDARRDQLDDELDAIRDAQDAKIDAVKAAAEAELKINKDRIDALEAQERDLGDQLQDLTSRREELIRLQLQAIGEQTELEELQKRVGDDPALAREIAIRKGRLKAIQDEKDSIDEQTEGIQDSIKAIQDLIKVEEDRAEQIKKARDDAIDAIREQTEEAIEAARKRADADIEAINSARDAAVQAAADRAQAEIDAVNAARDAAITASQERAEAEIEKINEVRDAAIEAAQDRAEADIEAIEDARDAAIEAAQERAEADIEALESVRDEAIETAEEIAADKIERIEEARDAAIEAAKEAADADIEEAKRATEELQKEAKQRADDEIAEIERVKTEAEEAARDKADAEIRESERATREKIEDIQEAGREAIKAQQDLNEEKQKEIDKQGQILRDKAAEEAFVRNQLLPRYKELLQLRISELAILNAQRVAQGEAGDPAIFALFQAVNAAIRRANSPEEIATIIASFLGTGFGGNFQGGGVVPGPLGMPRIIVAHGGEVVSEPGSPGRPVNITIQNVNMNSPADLERLRRLLSKAVGRDARLNSRMGIKLS